MYVWACKDELSRFLAEQVEGNTVIKMLKMPEMNSYPNILKSIEAIQTKLIKYHKVMKVLKFPKNIICDNLRYLKLNQCVMDNNNNRHFFCAVYLEILFRGAFIITLALA